jgi:cellulose synthase (UDP-forming)
VLGKLLPLWITLLLSTGWLNRGSRHALLADLPGWALAVPLAATVLASLWGRVQPFRITPKHRVQGRGGIAPVLALPLLVLLSLNGLNLVLILRHLSSGDGSAGGWLGLSWGGLTLLGLLVALRACRDPAAGDPSPWLALPLQGLLRGLDQTGHPVEHLVAIRAVSETGVALAPGALPADATVQWLELRMANAHDLNAPGLPGLPLAPQVQSGTRLSWAWCRDSPAVREQFLGWLYGRPGAWPQRQAPPEWRALLALVRRLISPGWEQQRLSLVPQQLEPQQAQDTPAWQNRSGRSPASAS